MDQILNDLANILQALDYFHPTLGYLKRDKKVIREGIEDIFKSLGCMDKDGAFMGDYVWLSNPLSNQIYLELSNWNRTVEVRQE